MKFYYDLKDTAEKMLSSDYKERFIAEYMQAEIRAAKLKTLLDKCQRNELDFALDCPLQVLVDQLKAIVQLLCILKTRAMYEKINLPEVVDFDDDLGDEEMEVNNEQ